jgi:hypothetical protein
MQSLRQIGAETPEFVAALMKRRLSLAVDLPKLGDLIREVVFS